MSIDLDAIQARITDHEPCTAEVCGSRICRTARDRDALIAYARDLEARLKEATVSALREAADDMDEVIARGDVAEVAAPVEGSVGRPEAISSRDSLYEEPSHWLRGYADALEDETIRAALTATEVCL